ncbi:hypothetical protein CN918_27090 [Priestia megaterium]|nr:hypothetical protein CN918_27090 [Priestia megaterium]
MDFFLDDYIEYKGELYGRLRLHSSEDFTRYVHVTKLSSDSVNWITISPSLEQKVKSHHEKLSRLKKK